VPYPDYRYGTFVEILLLIKEMIWVKILNVVFYIKHGIWRLDVYNKLKVAIYTYW